MTKTSDTIQDLQPDNINRVSVRLFFNNSEEQDAFLDWLKQTGQTFQWLDNWESQFQSPLPATWDHNETLDAVNRFEVIDHTPNGKGRALYHSGKVELSFQDSGKTLKVFLTDKDE